VNGYVLEEITEGIAHYGTASGKQSIAEGTRPENIRKESGK
jgi:hypothetical protein